MYTGDVFQMHISKNVQTCPDYAVCNSEPTETTPNKIQEHMVSYHEMVENPLRDSTVVRLFAYEHQNLDGHNFYYGSLQSVVCLLTQDVPPKHYMPAIHQNKTMFHLNNDCL